MPTASMKSNALARRVCRAVIVAALVLVASHAPVARAQEPSAQEDQPVTTTAEPSDFAVQPSGPDGPGLRDWFVYSLDPGAVFGDTVAISNLSDHPIRFTIYATDAAGVADVGGFSTIRDDETPTDVGTWIQLAASELHRRARFAHRRSVQHHCSG